MAARPRLAALGVATALLVVLDVILAWANVFRVLIPETRPMSVFSAINRQLAEVVERLHGPPPGPPPVVFIGNSQFEAAIGPLPLLARRLVDAGAPPGTQTVALCVSGTAATDAEVIARGLRSVRPGAVVFGLAAPDVGTPLERARAMPVTRVLDTGFRDGLVPPADCEARLDRWVRTAWHLYRYRVLLHDLVVPSARHGMPRLPDELFTPASILERDFGPERARELLALRAVFDRTQEPADFTRYVEAVNGRDYLAGLRDRWRGLEPQAVQLEAVRRFTAHVRAAGGRPAWMLLPQNALLERDPEIGSDVARFSADVAARLAVQAAELDVPLIDLRDALPPSAFADLNHLFYNTGVFFPVLAEALRSRGLLSASGDETQQTTDEQARAREIARKQDQPECEEMERRNRGKTGAEPIGFPTRPAPHGPPRGERAEPDGVIGPPRREVPRDAVPQPAREHRRGLAGDLARQRPPRPA